jgi:UDP-N-acetylmuramoyl-tripeptide--D-alanyl-D-alanine ligase
MQLVNKNLVIIGITGSQGKTTTKELLYELLKNKFKVVKTPENYNTDFGIAATILKDLKVDTEILILEIGTYRKGEIERICKLFTPNISLVTDVDTQHLGMFGSREALARGKGEIIKFMNENGIAIVNGDNKYCREYANIFDVKMDFVSSKKANFEKIKALENARTKYYLGTEVSPHKGGISLKIEDGKDTKYKIQANGVSEFLTNNLLMCIAASEEVGMSIDEINSRLKEIEFKSPRLSIDSGDNGITIINDTYSSSRKGLILAVNTMYKTKEENNLNRTVLVTKGIYELGRAKKNIYKALMKKLRSKIDVLITTDPLLAQAAKENNTHMGIHLVNSSDLMLYKIRTEVSRGDIVLLEGRLHPKIIKHIVSDYR